MAGFQGSPMNPGASIRDMPWNYFTEKKVKPRDVPQISEWKKPKAKLIISRFFPFESMAFSQISFVGLFFLQMSISDIADKLAIFEKPLRKKHKTRNGSARLPDMSLVKGPPLGPIPAPHHSLLPTGFFGNGNAEWLRPHEARQAHGHVR